MKKILFLMFFILLFSNLAFSQNKFTELEKVKKIKIFESTRQDVKKILAEYIDEDYDVEDYEQWFSTENVNIIVTFSKGNCAEDSEYWNVSKGLVTSVAIFPNNGITTKDVDFNFKQFKKEIEDKDFPEDFDYHDEKSGIFVATNSGEIHRIVFYPQKSKRAFLCSNENTLEILSGEERLVDVITPIFCILINQPPVINEILLSETEVFVNRKNEEIKISIDVSATDPENDVLTYNYVVSGGKIIGQGAIVVWDLTNAKRGTYTITVAIDDGCGDCAKPMTQTVFVK